MKNRYTTIAGYLLLVGAAATAAGQFMSGQTPDIQLILAALGGAGLVKASDGGH